MNAPNGSPVDYPVLEIQGVEYRLKFGLGALLRLEKLGVTSEQFFAAVGSGNLGTNSVTTMLSILAASLGQEIEGKWVPLKMEVEELADAIPLEYLGEIAEKMKAAQAKVSPAGIEESQAAPATLQ